MSATDAERFVQAVGADAAFAARLGALKDDPAAVYALVRAEGYDCSPDEIREAFLEAHGAELTPEQLQAIAGGMSDAAMIWGTMGVAAVIAGGMFAAAAGTF